MRLTMIGTGYVGLVSGHGVVRIDKDSRKIASLREGGVPIYEPGLEAMIARNVAAGRLSFATDLAEGLRGALAAFICVGTPLRELARKI